MILSDPRTLCLILLAVTCLFLVIRARIQLDRQRRAAEETPSSDPKGLRTAASGQYEHVPEDLAHWEVQMHETARRLSAQLDAKLGLLQSLITEADRAASRLEDAIERAHPTLPPGSQAESLRPATGPSREIGPDLELPLAEPSGSTADGYPAAANDRARRRGEIYRLADYGFPAAEIARRVGSPAGEVELILSLRDSK